MDWNWMKWRSHLVEGFRGNSWKPEGVWRQEGIVAFLPNKVKYVIFNTPGGGWVAFSKYKSKESGIESTSYSPAYETLVEAKEACYIHKSKDTWPVFKFVPINKHNIGRLK